MEVKVSVSFVPAGEMKKLNKELRGKNYTPAVLSFEYFEPTEEGLLLGEVLICRGEARKLAKENKISEDEQVSALILHGTKHILGIHHR